MPSASILKSAHKELLSFKSIFVIILIVILYAFLSVFLLNYRLFLFSGGPIIYKIKLLVALIPGLWTGLSITDFLFFIATAVLVGINILFLIKTVFFLRHKGKIKLSVGGATIIALVTTGCASCGLSILSVLGLSASLSFIPFSGIVLHLFSIFFLFFSSCYMFWEIHRVKYCKV